MAERFFSTNSLRPFRAESDGRFTQSVALGYLPSRRWRFLQELARQVCDSLREAMNVRGPASYLSYPG